MQPSDAPSFLSTTPAEGSFEPRQQESEELGGAASSPSPSPSRATRAGGETGGVRCQECRHRRAKAYCPHCRSCRGAVCPGHVKTTSHVPASQCSEGQQATLAASASAAAVDVEPIPNKRPRWTALPSAATAAAAAPTTTSSVDQPIATTVLERFAREVSLDAVFRRVRLGGPAEPEVAYYTTVTIAGHVFRGVLYDVGTNTHSGSTAAASDTDGSGEEVGSSSSSLSTTGGSYLDLTLGL
ncbi:hypothetical protein BDA96_02G289500 [Sorghum bicolor]|uniref:Uncharacterized protein n=2 Tax=Sorghum bicolor TaxID=4558 RepID=C5X676_SORBI|nr:protein SHI RELATED SEQUENCE 1 [Sorghum bicolor]EER97088.1 hypothetical protein SORBI_3002G275000 [Sorghum bicolor]KAG0544597.1 hypothetical protein BDA96_02G289500 [Sorghum bicolor]|eukprot:XP_002460567.1 protein SHI RELATED SEQUENCE 1 [Sorghum bicolor]